LPAVGKSVKRGEPIGTVESVKAVSEEPYGSGWMVVLEASDPKEVSSLMDAAAYRRHIGE